MAKKKRSACRLRWVYECCLGIEPGCEYAKPVETWEQCDYWTYPSRCTCKAAQRTARRKRGKEKA